MFICPTHRPLRYKCHFKIPTWHMQIYSIFVECGSNWMGSLLGPPTMLNTTLTYFGPITTCRVFFFKFLKQVHWLESSALISSKWRLSWWTSRSFLESSLVLATSQFFLSKYGEFYFSNLKNSFCRTRQPFFFFRQVMKFC